MLAKNHQPYQNPSFHTPELGGTQLPKSPRPCGASAELSRLPGAPGGTRGAAAGTLRVAVGFQRSRGGHIGKQWKKTHEMKKTCCGLLEAL